jgi:hypothetical protein
MDQLAQGAEEPGAAACLHRLGSVRFKVLLQFTHLLVVLTPEQSWHDRGGGQGLSRAAQRVQ